MFIRINDLPPFLMGNKNKLLRSRILSGLGFHVSNSLKRENIKVGLLIRLFHYICAQVYAIRNTLGVTRYQ